jgi:serine/threonine protein kinase
MAHFIPLCDDAGITLDNIKNGTILGRGSFGYSFLAGDKIIKIIVCNNTMDDTIINILKNETKLHSLISKHDDNNCFIKLYGYFMRDDNTKDYYYFNVEKNENSCQLPDVNNKIIKNPNGCSEIYLVMKKGISDLFTYYLEEKNSRINLIENIEKLIKFYKISLKTIQETGKIFIHHDIKIENIVILEDRTLRIIDFGISKLIDNFFIKYEQGTTYLINLLFHSLFYNFNNYSKSKL